MNVGDIAIKRVVTVEENDNIAKALSRMDEHHIHQLPVVKDGSVTGIVLLNHLLNREYNPSKTLVKNFKIKVPYLNPDMNLDDSISQIIQAGVRALPVVEDDKLIGILSETDLIKHVEFVSDIQPEKLMSPAISVNEKDSLDKAMTLMHENNISLLPVVNLEEKLLGCLGSLNIIRFLLEPQESPRYSELTAVEKESLKSFKVKYYMRDTFPLDVDEFSLKKVINALKNHEEIVVTKKEKPVGVVVPKDVLELAKLGQRYPVYISHLRDADTFEVSKFQDMLTRFMERFEKTHDIQKFFIYADVHKRKEEGHKKFSLRAKLITSKKLYAAKSFGWDLKEATHILLDNLRKQLIRNHEKHLGKSKRRLKG